MRCNAELLYEVVPAMGYGRPLLAYVGQLIDQNDVDILLEAVSEITRSDVGWLSSSAQPMLSYIACLRVRQRVGAVETRGMEGGATLFPAL